MKRFSLDIIMAAGIAIAMAFGSFGEFARQCEGIQTEVLRLHIPANSDSDSDQSVKLRLRDFLLTEYGGRLSQLDSVQEAKAAAAELLPEIERASCEFLAAEGMDYGAKAELCDMYFTTRVYDNVTLPAGEYSALRVTLGSGEGQNWWCVMFPPLCIPAAAEYREEAEDALPDVLIHDEEAPEVEIKFALFEFFKWLLGEKT